MFAPFRAAHPGVDASPRRSPRRPHAQPPSAVNRLPTELWARVLTYAELNPLQLVALGSQSRQLRAVSCDNAFWHATEEDRATAERERAAGSDAARGLFARNAQARLNALKPTQQGHFRRFCRSLEGPLPEGTAKKRLWTREARKHFDLQVMGARYGGFLGPELCPRSRDPQGQTVWHFPPVEVLRELVGTRTVFYSNLPLPLRAHPAVAAAALRTLPLQITGVADAAWAHAEVHHALFSTPDIGYILHAVYQHRPQLFGRIDFRRALLAACADDVDIARSEMPRWGVGTNLAAIAAALRAPLAPAEADAYRGSARHLVQLGDMLACPQVAHRLVVEVPESIEHLPAALRDDAEFVGRALRYGLDPRVVPAALLARREVLQQAVRRDPMAVRFASPALRQDLGLAHWLLALRPASAQPFCYFAPNVLDDLHFMREALSHYPVLAEGAGQRVRGNLLAAVRTVRAGGGKLLSHFHASLRDGEALARAVLPYAPELLGAFGPSIRRHVGWVQSCVRHDGLQLRYASELLRDDFDTVALAAAQNGLALGFASPRCRNNDALSRIAVSQTLEAVAYASNAVRDDEELLGALGIAQRPDLWGHLSYYLQSELARELVGPKLPLRTLYWPEAP